MKLPRDGASMKPSSGLGTVFTIEWGSVITCLVSNQVAKWEDTFGGRSKLGNASGHGTRPSGTALYVMAQDQSQVEPGRAGRSPSQEECKPRVTTSDVRSARWVHRV